MTRKTFAMFGLIGVTGILVFSLLKSYTNTPPGDLRDSPMMIEPAMGGSGKTPAGPSGAPYSMIEPAIDISGNNATESGLTALISKWLEVKKTMETAENALFAIERLKNRDDQAFKAALAALEACHVKARDLNDMAEKALAATPKTRGNIASAKLLLSAISDMLADSDNPPPAMQHIYNIGKISPEMKKKARPLDAGLGKILDELHKAGMKIMEFSGPL